MPFHKHRNSLYRSQENDKHHHKSFHRWDRNTFHHHKMPLEHRTFHRHRNSLYRSQENDKHHHKLFRYHDRNTFHRYKIFLQNKPSHTHHSSSYPLLVFCMFRHTFLGLLDTFARPPRPRLQALHRSTPPSFQRLSALLFAFVLPVVLLRPLPTLPSAFFQRKHSYIERVA